MRPILLSLLLLCIALVPLDAASAAGEKEARGAGQLFADVLTTGQPARLDPILPASGKIMVSLAGRNAGTGYFGVSQAKALLQTWLENGTGKDGKILHVEVQDDSYARVELSIRRTVHGGAEQSARFRLGLQPENGRWVLREIRETVR